MKKRSIIAGLGIALAAATAATAVPMSSAGAADGDSIAEVLLSDAAGDTGGFDRNWRDYDIVTQAVLLFPDLVAAASNDGASLTVLAPNDAAFRTLVADLTKKRPATEQETFAAVAALGTDTVKFVLSYHIVGLKADPATVLNSDNLQVPTLANGNTFAIDVINKRVAFVQFVDGDPNSRNPYLRQPNVGGVLSNGYIHGIDRVLRPIDL